MRKHVHRTEKARLEEAGEIYRAGCWRLFNSYPSEHHDARNATRRNGKIFSEMRNGRELHWLYPSSHSYAVLSNYMARLYPPDGTDGSYVE